jgi:hypothetical protein
MNFKKCLIYLLILLLAVSFAGCLGSDDSAPRTGSNNPSPGSDIEKPPANGEPDPFQGWSVRLDKIYVSSDV